MTTIYGSRKEEWSKIILDFERTHPNFTHELLLRSTQLSPIELKICIFARMNLSIKEIAIQLGISNKSVQNHRTRIRKKLGVEHVAALNTYLNMI
jgi:DNA-binding CsgD family transcriptional regulator